MESDLFFSITIVYGYGKTSCDIIDLITTTQFLYVCYLGLSTILQD